MAYHWYNPCICIGSKSIQDIYKDISKVIPNIAYFPIVRHPIYTNTTDTSNAERNHEPGNVEPKNKSFMNLKQPVGKPSEIYGLLHKTNQISIVSQQKYRIDKRLQYRISGVTPPFLYLLTS